MKFFVRGITVLLLCSICQDLFSQTDTTTLKSLYDRALDFDETKSDSVGYYARYIEEESKALSFKEGEVLSLRLKGIYNELRNDYDSAISYYYRSLEEAKRLHHLEYECAALGDLAMAYNNINQPEKTREFYKQALDIAWQRKEVCSIFTNCSNLGSIFNKLKQPDSALHYLTQAENIARQYQLGLPMNSLYNNIGNAWFHKKQWDKALGFFMTNYHADSMDANKEMLWYDYLNIGDVYIEKNNLDSAKKYIDLSLQLAHFLGSKDKEADVYALYAKYFENKQDYKSAYDYYKKWHVLDTALVSQQLLNTVADLQERYNLKQKDQQNKLLSLEIEHQNYQKRNMRLLIAGIALLAVLTLIILLLIKRKNGQLTKQNQIIQKQNSKLSKANSDKNSMISVVSHDLNAPFTSIKMWTQILQSDISNFTEDQKKALYRIQSSADNGELLIRNILHIEKEEINRPLNLQFLDISAFLEDVINAHTPQAQQKDIEIVYQHDGKFTEFMCDRYMLNRICENLLSNAIKFSPRGSKVYVKLESPADNIVIKVMDEGVGIAPEDIPYIFSKYGKISSMPTEGEYSTGLGLSIVKRLMDELNGKIFCESVLNKGSVFTVVLPR